MQVQLWLDDNDLTIKNQKIIQNRVLIFRISHLGLRVAQFKKKVLHITYIMSMTIRGIKKL